MSKRKNLKIVIWLLSGLLLVNLIILGYWLILVDNSPSQTFRVIFLDVGQGDSVLIQTPEGRNILVDGGPGRSVIHKLDKYIPITNRKIDLMILTHPDPDHLNGLLEVLGRRPVKEIITNGMEDVGPAYFEWEKLIQKKDVPYSIIAEPRVLSLDGASLQFFWPNQDLIESKNSDDNFYSIVFKLIHGENTFLLTGDATEETEEILLGAKPDLAADVLKAGHHGSKYSSSLEFLEKVNPAYGVISVGEENSFGHPNLRVLKNLEKIGAKVLRTDERGDIIFVSNGKELELKTEK